MMILALLLLWLMASIIGGLVIGAAIALRDGHQSKP